MNKKALVTKKVKIFVTELQLNFTSINSCVSMAEDGQEGYGDKMNNFICYKDNIIIPEIPCKKSMITFKKYFLRKIFFKEVSDFHPISALGSYIIIYNWEKY